MPVGCGSSPRCSTQPCALGLDRQRPAAARAKRRPLPKRTKKTKTRQSTHEHPLTRAAPPPARALSQQSRPREQHRSLPPPSGRQQPPPALRIVPVGLSRQGASPKSRRYCQPTTLPQAAHDRSATVCIPVTRMCSVLSPRVVSMLQRPLQMATGYERLVQTGTNGTVPQEACRQSTSPSPSALRHPPQRPTPPLHPPALCTPHGEHGERTPERGVHLRVPVQVRVTVAPSKALQRTKKKQWPRQSATKRTDGHTAGWKAAHNRHTNPRVTAPWPERRSHRQWLSDDANGSTGGPFPPPPPPTVSAEPAVLPTTPPRPSAAHPCASRPGQPWPTGPPAAGRCGRP